jgi:hypothetical protein
LSEQFGQDPLDELKKANPVDGDLLPSASLARMRARTQEKIVANTERPERRRSLPWAVAGLASAAVVVLAAIALVRPFAPSPTSAPPGTPNAGAASCVEQYSLETLARRAFAFDGTVTAIAGETVTFKINRPFKGAAGASVTLEAPGMTGTAITSIGGPNLAVGERYLVAGEDRFVWACGFTQSYDAAVAADWTRAFGG